MYLIFHENKSITNNVQQTATKWLLIPTLSKITVEPLQENGSLDFSIDRAGKVQPLPGRNLDPQLNDASYK